MRVFKKRVLWWWLTGFLSALIILLAVTLSMAGVVYSELPKASAVDDHNFEQVDVIVCLTGGRGRIRKALELFEKGKGKILYISGIDPQVSLRSLLKELQWVGPIESSRIILEKEATNTIQNAEQVFEFLKQNGFKSVLLVTSSYHVRRATYIFHKILLRDTRIDIAWYEKEPFDKDDWWKSANGIWVTVGEFFKFFYCYVRLAS